MTDQKLKHDDKNRSKNEIDEIQTFFYLILKSLKQTAIN